MEYTELENKLNGLIKQQVEHITKTIEQQQDLPRHLAPITHMHFNRKERLLRIEVLVNPGLKLDVEAIKYHQPYLKIIGKCFGKVTNIDLGSLGLEPGNRIPKFYQQEDRSFVLNLVLPEHFGNLPSDISPIHARLMNHSRLVILVPLFGKILRYS